MDSKPLVGVVTVTYNSAEVIDDFMTSMLAQHEERFHLYLVDNASTDATLEKVAQYPDSRITVIANPDNRGVAEGDNQGILPSLAAGIEWVLLLNNDTVFGPDLLGTLIEDAGKLDVSMLVPKMMYFSRPDRIWCAGGQFNRWRAYGSTHYGDGEVDRGQYDTPCEVEFSPACCLLIHQSVFERIGLVDETYFVYSEDNDFCLRAQRAGIRMAYTPRTKLLHKVSSLTGGKQSRFTIYYATRNRVYFVRKNLNPLLSAYYLFISELYFICLFITGREHWNIFLYRQKAFRDGLKLKSKPQRAIAAR